MLHASETWPLTKTNLQCLQRNNRAMIRQICSIKPDDVARVRSSELLAKLQLEDLNLILRERRLCWFGHVERSSGAIRTAYDMQIDGKRGAGRPKQTWKKLTEKDCREWKLTTVDPQERSTWRSGVRSAMRAASQLPGKGPTDVDGADYDMIYDDIGVLDSYFIHRYIIIKYRSSSITDKIYRLLSELWPLISE